jgi:hypothetical protein
MHVDESRSLPIRPVTVAAQELTLAAVHLISRN